MTAVFPSLKGASVFITGGGSGIGAALVAGFLEQGAKVAFADLADAAQNPDAMFLPCDVTDIAALTIAMEKAAAAHGPITVLVNNAANDMRYFIDEITPEIWDSQQAVNFKHYFFASQKAAAGMEAGGAIINFSSITYAMGIDGMAPYVSANAGIMGLTRAMARELGPRSIRVNAIAPGWVLTEKQREKWATEESLSAFLDKQSLKTHIQPQDLIGPVLFLASDASAMITGQTIAVDAGVVNFG
ncbi:SDR family NAD(P)-dependent oxidoreductase [Yoonia sp. 208BN28-4]|uniref:SDR family NAD(P)-dependent oxidoreductase n=1 Tax=Yoonia sp. 208BN28-4 TaxID=3126505 RepID=UPI0030B5DEE5